MAADRKPRLAIAATFTAEPIEETLDFWCRKFDLPFEIAFAPYNQVFQQLLGKSGLLLDNPDGVNVLLVRPEDWQVHAGSQVEQSSQELVTALRSAAARSVAPFVVCLCPPSPVTVADPAHSAELRRAEETIANGLDAEPGVHVVSSATLARLYGVANYYSPHTDELGHVPYTPDFFTALGTMVARRVWALRTRPYKVIALDCDGTLWKGTCGEDGPDGVRIDPPWRQLQEFMVQQHDAGMLLCVVSKNSPEDVFAVFDRRREEMPLKREHIVAWRVNWTAKSENLRSLAAELDLGIDSFMFLDDNPLECAEVEAGCPSVLALQLPAAPDRIGTFLSRVWAFDHLKITTEDKSRTALYRANLQRESSRAEALTMEAFLAGLQLQVSITSLAPDQEERVAQLTLRTNQFNVSGIRRSRAELQRLCASGERECLVAQVRDRFGDYGLVGVLLYAATPDALVVDSFLLSCRALGRKVEHRMLAELGKRALAGRAPQVDIPFVRTAKNQPALDFLESFGPSYRHESEAAVRFRFPSAFAATVGGSERV